MVNLMVTAWVVVGETIALGLALNLTSLYANGSPGLEQLTIKIPVIKTANNAHLQRTMLSPLDRGASLDQLPEGTRQGIKQGVASYYWCISCHLNDSLAVIASNPRLVRDL